MANVVQASCEVLIVGGGPCGLMLAIELGRRGVDTILIDAKPGTARNPQANATQARTMEHYRRLGFADEVSALGLPSDYPTDIAYFTRYADRELARFRLPSAHEAQASVRSMAGSWSAAELPHRVSQKFVEEALLRHARNQSSVRMMHSHRLTSFAEAVDSVTAKVEPTKGGEALTIHARYLVGADGARSQIRRALGIQMVGESGVQRDFFGGRMAAVYLRAKDFYAETGHDRAWMYWAFNTQRRGWLAAVDGNGEFFFNTQLRTEEEERPLDKAFVTELFTQATGRPIDFEILETGVWIAGHCLVAESLGRDRVWIAGDAAHLFTPAGGNGYNTAVEDAVNLAWKLAAAARGQAGQTLLESYDIERRRIATRNTGYARELARSIGEFVPSPLIEQDGPEGDLARQEAGVYLEAHARREFNIPGITFGGRYDGSPVIACEDAARPPDQMNVYQPTALPGGRPPHAWLPDGTSLYDRFGPEWTLLVLASPDGATDALRAAFALVGQQLDIVLLPDEGLAALYERRMALIRPDQIVAWRGDALPDDPAQLVRHLLGHHTAAVVPA